MKCYICRKSAREISNTLIYCSECAYAMDTTPIIKSIYGTQQYAQEMFSYWQGKRKRDAENLNTLRADLVHKYVPAGKNLLDFGCGVGSLYDYIDHDRYSYRGYDINSFYVPIWVDYGRPCYVFLDKTIIYHCLCMFDVLEHLLDPIRVLSEISHEILIITIPDFPWLMDTSKEQPWQCVLVSKHHKPGEHVHYFSQKSIEKLLNGYKILEINYGESFNGRNYVATYIAGKL